VSRSRATATATAPSLDSRPRLHGHPHAAPTSPPRHEEASHLGRRSLRPPRSRATARPRRVFLGLGAAFVDQVACMASDGASSRSFVAGARPRQGVSPVEQVLLRGLLLALCFCPVPAVRAYLIWVCSELWVLLVADFEGCGVAR
jgi:hypothetical protein